MKLKDGHTGCSFTENTEGWNLTREGDRRGGEVERTNFNEDIGEVGWEPKLIGLKLNWSDLSRIILQLQSVYSLLTTRSHDTPEMGI